MHYFKNTLVLYQIASQIETTHTHIHATYIRIANVLQC